jgi:hypothetical protein
MPSAGNKIITKLQERRQIEAELRQMLAIDSDLELRRRAQRIASMGSQVLPAIIGSLDRADAPLLAAMGVVATFLERDEVIAALRQAVLQSQRTDQGRIAAMTILERFLGEPADDALLASLRDAGQVAVASLEEVLAQAERNPAVLIEYVQGLDQQEPDMVLAIARALRDFGDQRVVEPLRMMAQDVREEIGAEAVRALGAVRLPEAARALQMLPPVIAPRLRPMAERALRKLRFVGVELPAQPDPDPAWRALVSPVDAQGRQSVWFILENPVTAQARFLNVHLSDQAGAVEAVGHVQVPVRLLPPRRLPGSVHDIALPDGSGANLMLESSFDLGRRLVVEALVHNRETQIPVAGVLRLLSSWLWDVGGAGAFPSPALPKLPADDASLLAVADRLLAHPAFASWTLGTEASLQAAEDLLRHPGRDLKAWTRRLAGELFARPVLAQAFSRRLIAMSEWLLLAGEDALSRLALVSAQALLEEAIQEHPFVQALVRRDLELALYSLERTPGSAPG